MIRATGLGIISTGEIYARLIGLGRLNPEAAVEPLKPDKDPLPALNSSSWFAEEVQPHESSLRFWLRSLFPSLPDTDDLVQESYLRLIRAREAGKITCAKAYLFTTARNAALDFFRRRQVATIEAVGDMSDSTALDEAPGVADAVNKQQELELLAEAVRGLPDRCRQTLTLRLLYGLSHREIAAELRISEHTVKAQLAKGMRRCAAYLAERGISGPGGSREAGHR